MKSLKVLACTACLMGSLTAVGVAKDVHTLAGTMTVPNDVTMVTASQTNTRNYALTEAQKALNTSVNKTNAMLVSPEQSVVNFLQNLGVNYDAYQLQGNDKNGQKDAFIVAVDVKTMAEEMNKGRSMNPNMAVVMGMLDQGKLDPAMEQLMLTSVNNVLPKQTTVIPLNEPINVSGRDPKKVSVTSKSQATLTLEDTEPMKRLDSTKYQTYTVGSRLLLNSSGWQAPYYAKAALVMKPGKPTLYIGLTSDVQRDYFSPIFDKAFKSIR